MFEKWIIGWWCDFLILMYLVFTAVLTNDLELSDLEEHACYHTVFVGQELAELRLVQCSGSYKPDSRWLATTSCS